jgi:hypothetical protein
LAVEIKISIYSNDSELEDLPSSSTVGTVSYDVGRKPDLFHGFPSGVA